MGRLIGRLDYETGKSLRARDGRGVPLAVRLTGANRNNSQEALASSGCDSPLHGARGRPRQRPDCVLGDRGYDAAAIRRGLRTRHIVPLLAMRRREHGSGLGRWRWVVERTFAWLSQFRRLRVRYDKRADIHEAFLSLGCALICWQSLRKTWRTAEADAFVRRRPRPCLRSSWRIAPMRLFGSLRGAGPGHRSTLGRHSGLISFSLRSRPYNPRQAFGPPPRHTPRRL